MGENIISEKEQVRLVEDIAANSPYSIEAIWFVLHGTRPYSIYSAPSDHIEAAEFCWRLHDLAILAFGSGDAARQKLTEWGLASTEDFGVITYQLIGANLMQKDEQDSIGDFNGVFDFANSFVDLKHQAMPKPLMQWRLSTLLAITTFCSIAFAGASKLGIPGAVGTTLATWLAIIGGSCIYLGLKDKSTGWLLSVALGIALLMLGVLGFVFITSV